MRCHTHHTWPHLSLTQLTNIYSLHQPSPSFPLTLMHKHQRKERKKRRRREGRSREEEEEEEGEEEEDGAHQLLEVVTSELLLPHAINLTRDEGGSPKLHLLQAQAMEEPQG